MLASELIKKAYILSGIVSDDFEQVTSSQVQRALEILNDVLAEKIGKQDEIPYFTHLDVPTVASQEIYGITGLIDVDSITYTLGTLRYPLKELSREEYFGRQRINSISSIPKEFYVERKKGGADVYIYYTPGTNGAIQITGRFSLLPVTLNTVMDDIFDGLYLSYLKYKVMRRIADYENHPVTQAKLDTLDELERAIKTTSRRSMSFDITTYLNSGNGGSASTDPYYEARFLRGFRGYR